MYCPGDLPACTLSGESGFLNDTPNLLLLLPPGIGDIDTGSATIACALETTRPQTTEDKFGGVGKESTLGLTRSELPAVNISSSL